jgi:hypothetical protein
MTVKREVFVPTAWMRSILFHPVEFLLLAVGSLSQRALVQNTVGRFAREFDSIA